jgi:uncharacterized protein YkwD
MRQCIGFGRAAITATVTAMLAACGGGGGGDGSSGERSAVSAADTPASTPTALAAAASPASIGSTVERAFSDRMLELLNAARSVARNCGATAYPAVGPLAWNTQTEQAARAQAEYLQQNNLFSHTGSGGSSVGERLTATGYVWSTVGENIAAGYTDMAAVVQGWIDSPGHCVNVMNGNFVDLGVVQIPGTSSNTYRTYWGMVLARPR